MYLYNYALLANVVHKSTTSKCLKRKKTHLNFQTILYELLLFYIYLITDGAVPCMKT